MLNILKFPLFNCEGKIQASSEGHYDSIFLPYHPDWHCYWHMDIKKL